MLRILTPRGRALLVTGAVLAGFAVALGQRDLLRVAVLLIALPLVSAFLVTRRNDRVDVGRAVTPQRASLGTPARARLMLRGSGARRSGPLMVTDHVDPAAGHEQRALVESLEPGERVVGEYPLDTRTRGRHHVGPLTFTLEDPFGLARASRSTSSVRALTVVPRVLPLRSAPPHVGTGGSGEGSTRRTAVGGQDDIGTREYRAGDELRRVHWRSTARTGSLMVRQEEQPWEARALVVLDTRRSAHHSVTGASTRDPSTSSFEWAVEAAASVAAHLARTDRRVHVSAGRTTVEVTGAGLGPLLDALATVRTERDGQVITDDIRQEAAPVVVAVLGALDARDVSSLAHLRAPTTSAVAVLIDVESWATRPRAVATAASDPADALRAAGWLVVTARRGESIADVWDRVSR